MRIDEKSLDKVLDFIIKADGVKGIERTGWVWAGVKGPEHVGDHSFSVALLSYIIGKKLSLDASKCMAMGLIHDINEVITGDIASRAQEKDQKISNMEKHKLENKNTLRMLSYLDKNSYSDFRNLWKEMEAQKTREAILVKQIDPLDYIIQISIYSKQIKSDKKFTEFFAAARKKITLPELVYLYDKIKKSAYKRRGLRLE